MNNFKESVYSNKKRRCSNKEEENKHRCKDRE